MKHIRSAQRPMAAFVLTTAVLLVATVTMAAQAQALIPAVRAAIARQDFAAGEQLVTDYRTRQGVTPEMLEALSWLGRGALAAEQWDKADGYAQQTYALALAALNGRSVDQEPRLPIALGAAIEVQAHVSAHAGARSEAVAFLQRELKTYTNTSLEKRIQKNLNLLSLEGTRAPGLDLSEPLGSRPLSLDSLRGKVVILFFWAHWCPDCKIQAPILATLMAEFEPRGLAIIAPTQRYGYVAGGRTAGVDEENRYIAEMRATRYGFLAENAVTLSEANHRRYGVSTTPTLVILDRTGTVRLYHPGGMSEAELRPLVRGLLEEQPLRSAPAR